MMFDNVKLVHETFPDKHLMFTEGCVDVFNAGRLHDWSLGERYGSSMIRDLNNGTVGWTDWNVLLDEKGGPTMSRIFASPRSMPTRGRARSHTQIRIITLAIFQIHPSRSLASLPPQPQLFALDRIHKHRRHHDRRRGNQSRRKACEFFPMDERQRSGKSPPAAFDPNSTVLKRVDRLR